jgi:hypothetical protein
MNKDPALLRTTLRWQAACELVSNALHPPVGAPATTAADMAAALHRAGEALDELEVVWRSSALPDSDSGQRNPDAASRRGKDTEEQE